MQYVNFLVDSAWFALLASLTIAPIAHAWFRSNPRAFKPVTFADSPCCFADTASVDPPVSPPIPEFRTDFSEPVVPDQAEIPALPDPWEQEPLSCSLPIILPASQPVLRLLPPAKVEPAATPKRRGRPPKAKAVELIAEQPKRKRGRPKKAA